METTVKYKGPNPKACGCKGIRSCLLCNPNEANATPTVTTSTSTNTETCPIRKGEHLSLPEGNNEVERRIYKYCLHCGEAWQIPDSSESKSGKLKDIDGATEVDLPEIDEYEKCHHGTSPKMKFPGIHVIENFVSEDEEESLDKNISGTVFVNSQSGRRKQDFGPKVNFKKRKLKIANFNGLPSYSEILYNRMTSCPVLADFLPVEMCNLEYSEERGAHIDPHFDDFWVWGERLVTLNLLSDSTLAFTMDGQPDLVRVPMPRRSLIVVSGPARHKWKHGITSQDIQGRRLAMTFRELSAIFQEAGPRQAEGQELLEVALSFKGCAVGS